jgi:hypothetical protein
MGDLQALVRSSWAKHSSNIDSKLQSSASGKSHMNFAFFGLLAL